VRVFAVAWKAALLASSIGIFPFQKMPIVLANKAAQQATAKNHNLQQPKIIEG
jgi:hypothetical protein